MSEKSPYVTAPQGYLTPKEFAEQAGVPRATIQRLLDNRIIPCIRLGTRVYVDSRWLKKIGAVIEEYALDNRFGKWRIKST